MSLLVLTSLAQAFSKTNYLQAYLKSQGGGEIIHTVLVYTQLESLLSTQDKWAFLLQSIQYNFYVFYNFSFQFYL